MKTFIIHICFNSFRNENLGYAPHLISKQISYLHHQIGYLHQLIILYFLDLCSNPESGAPVSPIVSVCVCVCATSVAEVWPMERVWRVLNRNSSAPTLIWCPLSFSLTGHAQVFFSALTFYIHISMRNRQSSSSGKEDKSY